MESKKIKAFYHSIAQHSITRIGIFIEKKGFPETAENFTGRLYAFGESLAAFPEKYPLCRFSALTKLAMRCAVFEKHYVFIYKPIRNRLVIYNIIHTSALA